MRWFAMTVLLLAPASASAQLLDSAETEEESQDSLVLTGDDLAQLNLGDFRAYLERIRGAEDDGLYRLLDPRLDDLEGRETAADVIFWTSAGLGVAAVVAGIPVYEEVSQDAGIAMFVAGGGTFLLGVIIQAVLRPSHGDLLALIDLHDEHLGRR